MRRQAKAVRLVRRAPMPGGSDTTAARPPRCSPPRRPRSCCRSPAPYDLPVFVDVKVHRDLHVSVGKALYSAPAGLRGQVVQARADRLLVKLHHRGRLVKTHPRQGKPRVAGSTDPIDMPEHSADYAMRDVQSLVVACKRHGPNIGLYAERVLDDPLPWTRMRAVYRLLRAGPALRARTGRHGVHYGACGLILGPRDVVWVTKITSCLA